jgi:hypothetical protein
MRGFSLLCAVLFWGALRAPAQDVVPPDSGSVSATTAQLNIQSDVDSAIVFIDSARVGQTPLVVRGVKAGFHRLKIMHPDLTNWLTGNMHDSIEVQPGEDRVLRYSFGKRYLILSVPSGAELFIGDSLGGSTPYLLSVQEKESLPSITLKRGGYDSALVNLSEAQRGLVTVSLKKIWTPDNRGDEPEQIEAGESHGTFRVYLAGAITVGFGAAAAYFKIQADAQNNRYLQDFSSASQSQVHIYDTAAAISLALAEVGFGFFAYYLLAE